MTDISAYVFGDDFVAEDVPRWVTPEGASRAVMDFLCDREITPGMRAYLAQHVGDDGADRLIRAALDERLSMENAPAAGRVIGEVVIAPALDALGDDAWGYSGQSEPGDYSDSPGAGEWAYRVDVDDIAAFNREAAPRLEGAQRLFEDLIATDWEYCESCDGWRPSEEEPCLDGCAVYRECPLCGSELDAEGVCTDRDCPFVACPVCADGVHGFPAPDREPWVANCEHLVLAESGEAPERFMLDAIKPPSSVTAPPGKDWFDSAAEIDLGPLGKELGLGKALATADLSEDEWTQQMLMFIASGVARVRSSQRIGSQIGVVTSWDADPAAFWAEVDRIVRAVRDHVGEA